MLILFGFSAILQANENKNNTLDSFLDNYYLLWALTHLTDEYYTVKKIKRDFRESLTIPLKELDIIKFEKWKAKRHRENVINYKHNT